MAQQLAETETAYWTVEQIARQWRVSSATVREKFRGRRGVIRMGSAPNAKWRIPAWLVAQVAGEMAMPETRPGDDPDERGAA